MQPPLVFGLFCGHEAEVWVPTEQRLALGAVSRDSSRQPPNLPSSQLPPPPCLSSGWRDSSSSWAFRDQNRASMCLRWVGGEGITREHVQPSWSILSDVTDSVSPNVCLVPTGKEMASLLPFLSILPVSTMSNGCLLWPEF